MNGGSRNTYSKVTEHSKAMLGRGDVTIGGVSKVVSMHARSDASKSPGFSSLKENGYATEHI
jgi:hypothetical protein